MPTATESVINYLTAKRNSGEHKGPDLIDRFLKHGCDMEVQINVSSGAGEPVAGKRSTFSDGIDTWFNFRIPKNAYDDPFFRDFELKFPLDLHCEGIGSTGWDWKAKRSRWVGFDFDSIVGHAQGVGVTSEELNRVREAAKALPYVEVRRSTGGAGLHLYVNFEDLPAFDTKNHNEHAALARCVLGVMSRDAAFDFRAQIDACGGNMWLWHRKSLNTEGLALIKIGDVFPSERLPDDWRSHLPVVSGRQAKVRLPGMEQTEEDLFDQLASAHRLVPLDAKHNAMMDAIAAMNITCLWVSDHHLLQTHTVGFKRLMERAEEFGIQGVYDTNSQGTDLQTPNCFAFPLDYGAWKIYRFGSGGRVTEAPTWDQDAQGRTTCCFNMRPNLDTAARSMGGRKLAKRSGYEFESLEKAVQVAKMLKPGVEINVEEHMKNRVAVIQKSKDGQIAIEVPKKGSDEDRPMGDWNNSDKKSAWTQVFDIAAQPEKLEVNDYDNLIRCLETSDGQTAGWAAKKADGDWTRKPTGEIKMILQDMGHPKTEAEQIMGRYARNPWKLVSLPFQPEYPQGRCWNLNAPQYAYVPAPRLDSRTTEDENGEDSKHPNWDRILDHIGSDLTRYIKELDWTASYAIRTGADYLRAIFASILKYPCEPTPYLFLFGPENSGKSILHESFSLLVTSGVVTADRALTNQSDFNGELAGAILCIVEEKDIGRTPGAYAKIKAAVTSPKLSIRKMRTDSYMVDNTTHWIQTANQQEACPVFEGDTRITMIFVPEFEGEEIPKTLLLQRLREEAPEFMRTLMDLPLPPPSGRLRIPIISTQYKQIAERKSRSMLDDFITEHLHDAPGQLVPFAEFYTRFVEWLPVEERSSWSRVKVSRSLPMKFPSGTGNQNKTYIINASWEKVETPPDTKRYFLMKDRIKRED